MTNVTVRAYRGEDASATLAIFLAAVTVTASGDYSPAQIAAWARPEQRDLANWERAMRSRHSYVAIVEEEAVGFSNVSDDGYIDMMFVAPQHARCGVARSLLKKVESHARDSGAHCLSADVSITARPFFERHGFVVEAEQHPVVAGVEMTNFHMIKRMGPVR